MRFAPAWLDTLWLWTIAIALILWLPLWTLIIITRGSVTTFDLGLALIIGVQAWRGSRSAISTR